MAEARIIDDSGQEGPWTDILREVLGAAGFGLTTRENESAALTILLHTDGSDTRETEYRGDLLVLGVPGDSGQYGNGLSRTEVIGTNRLKARHNLSDIQNPSVLIDELRPLVNLFVH